MFNYEEFIAKAGLYFARGAQEEEGSDQRAVWLLLGLEFLLRAPLARVHASLLAAPEGDSLLHAAGIERARGMPRSISIKTVIDRLTKVDPNFGEDRGKDAAFVAELRNEELHSSGAALSNAGESVWMPRFLNVSEAVCRHLQIDISTLISEDVLQAATAYRATTDKAVQAATQRLQDTARAIYEALSSGERETRISLPAPAPGARRIVCPVCQERAAWLGLTSGRTSAPTYNEDAEQITYRLVRVVSSLNCAVCGLTLNTSAEVIAAGVSRLFIEDVAEDRYAGWEELMTYQDAIDFLGVSEDYGND